MGRYRHLDVYKVISVTYQAITLCCMWPTFCIEGRKRRLRFSSTVFFTKWRRAQDIQKWSINRGMVQNKYIALCEISFLGSCNIHSIDFFLGKQFCYSRFSGQHVSHTPLPRWPSTETSLAASVILITSLLREALDNVSFQHPHCDVPCGIAHDWKYNCAVFVMPHPSMSSSDKLWRRPGKRNRTSRAMAPLSVQQGGEVGASIEVRVDDLHEGSDSGHRRGAWWANRLGSILYKLNSNVCVILADY